MLEPANNGVVSDRILVLSKGRDEGGASLVDVPESKVCSGGLSELSLSQLAPALLREGREVYALQYSSAQPEVAYQRVYAFAADTDLSFDWHDASLCVAEIMRPVKE